MTIITSFMCAETNDCYFLTDLLLTTDQLGASTFDLPFSRGASTDVPASAGLRRKSFLPHPDILFQFSGRFLAGYSVAKDISTKVGEILSGEFENVLKESLAELGQAELDNFSCILSIIRRREGEIDRFETASYNCVNGFDGAVRTTSAGSGSVFATAGFSLSPFSLVKDNAFATGKAYERSVEVLTKCISAEIFDADVFPYFRFGGWYELFELRHQGFFPVRYAINLFRENSSESYRFLRRFYSWSSSRGLYINSINPSAFIPEYADPKSMTIWHVKNLVPNCAPENERLTLSGLQAVGGDCEIIINVLIAGKKVSIDVSSGIEGSDIFVDGGSGKIRMDVDQVGRTIDRLRLNLQ